MGKTELLDDTKTETVETSVNPNELDEILKGYNSTPMQTTQQPEQHNEPIFDNPKPIENSPVNWRGNPAYFQTGKKAGQLRPGATKPQNTTAETAPDTIGGEIITGVLFITLLDLIVPTVIVLLNNKFSDNPIDVKDLQFTAKQKNELAPIADKVMMKLNYKASPEWLLAISVIGIYGLNFAALKMGNKND